MLQKLISKFTKIGFGLAIAASFFSAPLGWADIPNNCAQDTEKLEQLVSTARFLPENMDRHLLGNWLGSKLGAKVKITMRKVSNSRLVMDMHVKAPLFGIDMKDTSGVVFCFSNQRHIAVHTALFGENQRVRLRVDSKWSFRVLDGRLSGQYKKVNSFD